MSSDWKFRYKNAKRKEAEKEFDLWERSEFIAHILELRSEIITLRDEKNPSISTPEVSASLEKKNYNQKWSLPTKITFILACSQKPMKSEEINTELLRLDSHYKDYDHPKNNLTVSLNRTIKNGRIKRIKLPGIRSLLFALPSWFENDGNLKAQYKLPEYFG
jgi:hypothetical protein